jgi:hypothetical protein
MWIKKIIQISIISGLSGCNTPAQNFNNRALEFGFDAQTIQTEQFRHKIYSANLSSKREILHVYLDGDGTPWERKRWISDDPTAREPLIMRLMVQDKLPSILLGRPCYYGFSHDLACDSRYWTSHRYSKEVVQSMSNALNVWLSRHKFRQVVLIGYSGGGSLAVLMADKIHTVTAVVTIAANLNVKTWSEFHGYSTLKGSLNPAEEVEMDVEIRQIHFAGEEDTVVPAFIIKEFADGQKQAEYYQLKENDHACCWENEWPKILKIIGQ